MSYAREHNVGIKSTADMMQRLREMRFRDNRPKC